MFNDQLGLRQNTLLIKVILIILAKCKGEKFALERSRLAQFLSLIDELVVKSECLIYFNQAVSESVGDYYYSV